MTTRRSIFKCIPAMLAAAFLPKSWRAQAAESKVGHVTLHEGMIDNPYRKLWTIVGETGPGTITTAGDGWTVNQYTGQPLGWTFGESRSYRSSTYVDSCPTEVIFTRAATEPVRLYNHAMWVDLGNTISTEELAEIQTSILNCIDGEFTVTDMPFVGRSFDSERDNA